MSKKHGKRKVLWLKVFFITFILFVLSFLILILTENPILFPTVFLLGNFMVPISFSAFFYERRQLHKLGGLRVIEAFVFAGVLGVLAAALLEPLFILKLDIVTAFEVGLIEELAKITGLYLITSNLKFKTARNGIILGAATGMGFAALESNGYAFSAFLQSAGNLDETVFVTLLRGISSPIGHGLWTAILAGVLFREVKNNKFVINGSVVRAYLLVSFLHGLWDAMPTIFSDIVLPGIDFIIAEAIVGLVGLVILRRLWVGARQASGVALEKGVTS